MKSPDIPGGSGPCCRSPRPDLGVLATVLVPVLASLGAGSSVALLGVLTWRLVQFWLPVPIAPLTYLSLQLGALRSTAHSGVG